ncbi:hypothetical protein ACFUJR_22435 [Streptomyces sp. NPDC057271]
MDPNDRLLLADHDGTTPLDHATRRGFDGIAGLLEAASARAGRRAVR